MIKISSSLKVVGSILDQNSDKSLSSLKKFSSLLTDAKVGAYVWEIGNYRTMDKVAECHKFACQDLKLFPVNTKEDTILSKVYFEGQRSKIASLSSHLESEIESKLDTYMDIHDIPDVFNMHKEASVSHTDFKPRYLLPSYEMFKVATVSELEKAASAFTSEISKFSVPERVEFSKEFSKIATTIKDQIIPKEIQVYCGVMDSDLDNVKALLSFRKTAANRVGKEGHEYEKLAAAISNVGETDKDSLEKLADLIHSIDEKYGFTYGKMSKAMPDAYATVFNKIASEDDNDGADSEAEENSVKGYTKADIIAQFGEDAVEALENPDGSINYKKLKVLVDSSPLKEVKKDS